MTTYDLTAIAAELHHARGRAAMEWAAGEIERLRVERDELRAVLMPYADQSGSSVENFLRARQLCGLPDFPPITETMAELRAAYGHYFDGVDVDAFMKEVRGDDDE
jgi:hypothetical protein